MKKPRSAGTKSDQPAKKKTTKPQSPPPAGPRVGEKRGNLAEREAWFARRTGKTA